MIGFGFLKGLSGNFAFWGQPSLDAATAAIGEINAAGGVLGRAVELIVEDNLSTQEGAVSGYNRIRNRIDALGGVESFVAETLLDVVATDEMPTMCPVCDTTVLDTAGGNFLWRIAPSATAYGVVSAQVARDLGYTRVAILAERVYPWEPEDPADSFRDAWEQHVGGEIVTDVRFEEGTGASMSQIEEAFAARPEAVYLGAGIYSAIPFLRPYLDGGFTATLIVSPEFFGSEFAELVAALPAGRVMAASVTDDSQSPAYAAYAGAHEQYVGRPVPPAAVRPYQFDQYTSHFDQYIALALAMTAAGSTDGAAVAAAVPAVLNAPGTKVYTYADGVAALERGEEIDYDGPSGSLELNEYGNLVSPHFAVNVVVDGEWAEIEVIQLDPTLNP